MSDSKVSITITNRAPGLQPPLYVAGSFSNPEWVPELMDYTTSDDGVHTFTKTLQVEPESKIAYKFRAGEGDWWLLNEDAPTVTDDAGNRNNILEVPKATTTDEHASFKGVVAESAHIEPADSNQDFTENGPHVPDSGPETEQRQPVSQVDALKHIDGVDQARSSTPEFIKTINEVAESAALLDRSTPEPEAPDGLTGKNKDQSSAALLPNAADTAAEVADSAALLDRPTPEPQEADVDSTGKDKEAPSEVAAQVADTAADLDTEDNREAPSEVAAQVADTAAKLDNDELKASETVSPAYKTLADVKAGRKDESLEIAGFSNDQEPVPLFAHECAGLYEDDEIPGADEPGPSSFGGRLQEHSTEDYDDPTLERFPSTRDEIISTVRKVETGLNADQVAVEGVPLSPIAHARNSPTTDTSPVARGQQHLPLPPSLTGKDERSLSSTSLHSIAEDAEGAEEHDTVQPQSEYIADVVEKSIESGETDDGAKEAEAKHADRSAANEIAPVVEQAETAEKVIEVAQEAEGEQSKENALASEDLPAIVELTPTAGDIASVVELPSVEPDISAAVEQQNGSDEGTQLASEHDADKVQQDASKEYVPRDGEAETLTRSDSEANDSAHKPALESLVTVPSPSVKPSTSLLSPVSDDDEAVVVKSNKGKEETAKTGYLTPERAATPQPEEPGSPREPAPNTADPIAESELEPSVPREEAGAPSTEPQSPQIVVSKPGETHPDEAPLPAATLDEAQDENGHAKREAPQDSETDNEEKVAKIERDDQFSREVKLSNDAEASKSAEIPATAETPLNSKSSENINGHQTSKDSNGPKIVEDSQEVEAPHNEESHKDILEANRVPEESSTVADTSDGLETPATVNENEEAGPHSESTATASARESHTGTLKQRSVARPNPTDRTNTPVSITDSHKEAAKGGNWFSAFLRLVFIDFFGGFVRKLYGGGRKTLVMTAVVLVAVGYASFRRTTETEGQVVSY